jgi:serine protease AprX
MNWGVAMRFSQKLVNIFLLIMLVVACLGISSSPGIADAQAGMLHIQPLLLDMARKDPGQIVQVIVQQADQSGVAKTTAIGLGGQVSRDLTLINAFVVTLNAGSVMKLAANSHVRHISLDAPVTSTACTGDCISGTNLTNAYVKAVGADKVWNMATPRQGKGIGVAVVDSGINYQTDLYTPSGANRVVTSVRYNTDYNQTTFDNYGHGSAIAGVIGGNGRTSNGKYIGIAPQVNIINVKVSNDDGRATTSNVVDGLQWVYNNRTAYNIRVVNLSFNSSVANSYNQDPLDAAVEVLWFNKIVVVVSAGNNGSATLYPPANDPFVITVGAADDKGTTSISDDTVATFSAYGNTANAVTKPDLVAPGRNIISLIGNVNGIIPAGHPANKVDSNYFRMSGTSMAAPVVSGAVALLLEDEPNLSPDQVKYRLMATANKNWAGYNSTKAGAGYIDVYAAVNGSTSASANTGITPSQLLSTGTTPINSSIGWNSIGWNSIGWNSIGWNSIGWNSIGWNSDYWE